MHREMTVQEMLQQMKNGDVTLVDVRSPSEYEDSTIPGSVNIPLFSDDERAEIGTLYKQVSPRAAREKGLEIVSAKLPALVKQFEETGEGPRVIFCWRGGMRSKTTATLLSLWGLKVYRLQGGFRSFRRWVVETLDRFRLDIPAVVLNGYTGTGKTELLRRLQEEGRPVLDLERLAGHRGSIFGQIGLQPKNQKSFDSGLVLDLLELRHKPYFLMEGESRRIGKVVLPDFLVRAKEQAVQIFVDIPRRQRAARIVQEYDPESHHDECVEAFQRIRKRIHTPVAAQIQKDLEDRQYLSAVEQMLEYYYDPRYNHSISRQAGPKAVCRAENLDDALEMVKTELKRLGFA